MHHEFINSDVTKFDSNCLTCGGKKRDAVHGWGAKTQADFTVANIIADQIGHRAFLMMGTTHKVGDEKSLSFDVKGCREYSKIRVTLERNDTYTVEFFKFRNLAITHRKSLENVYADGLHQAIEHNTGLRLSL